RGAACENVEHVLSVFHPASRGQLVAKDNLLAGVVNLRAENESATLRRRFDRPAGEGTSDVDHILLGVSAIDSQSVKLEQLPSVVFVQAWALALLWLLSLALL